MARDFVTGLLPDGPAPAGQEPSACDPSRMQWQPIATAPKDKSILAWCDHEADPWSRDEGKTLTLYAAHADGVGHADTGPHIVEWGGGFDDRTWEYPNEGHLPDWWHVAGTEFECAANPTHWLPLPPPPAPGTAARSAETFGLGPKGNGPVGVAEAPTPSPDPASGEAAV